MTLSKKIALVILQAVNGALAIYVARSIFYHYKFVVEITLGTATIFMLFKLLLSSKLFSELPIEYMLKFPGNLKYFAYAFGLIVISFWGFLLMFNALLLVK